MNQRVRSFYVRTDGVHILLSRRGGLLSEHEGWRPWPRRGRGCQGRSSLKHLPGKHPDTQDEDEGVVPRGTPRDRGPGARMSPSSGVPGAPRSGERAMGLREASRRPSRLLPWHGLHPPRRYSLSTPDRGVSSSASYGETHTETTRPAAAAIPQD
uniref:Uncharacterized protein n=1 Tax=Rangifer tarandus platyrhynchus TaxID=3082113 RepID=A0ACB0EZQ1_RANTA|nr:unnamed protein product [Rangifer tarandus platyrhynchus]